MRDDRVLITTGPKSLQSKKIGNQQKQMPTQPAVLPMDVPGYMLGLQHQYGNRFVQQVMGTKSPSKQLGDKDERGENRIAKRATHTSGSCVSEQISYLRQTQTQLSPSPGKSVWGGFRIYGDSTYITSVRAHLNALNATRIGKTLLADISADRSSMFSPLIRIESGPCGYLPGRIYYNTSSCPVSGCPGAWAAVPNYIYLFHELVHAYLDYFAGKGTHAERECMATGLGPYFTSIPYNENRLRCELGLPVRPCYDGQCAKYAPPTCLTRVPTVSPGLQRQYNKYYEQEVLALTKRADSEITNVPVLEAIHQHLNKERLSDKSFRGNGPIQRQLSPDRRTSISSQLRGQRPRHHSVIAIDIDTERARIDNSRSVNEITRDFYDIPIEILPPNVSILSGPILTLGKYGCNIRRYGLTKDDFSLTYTLSDPNIQHFARSWSFGGLQTVECWASQVRFRLRLRQTIYLPNDLKTHPCTKGVNPSQQRREILEHEHGHEADNKLAAEQVRHSLRNALTFTSGIGYLMAMVRITNDPKTFIQECGIRIRQRLNALQKEHEIMYARLSAELASVRDPHDRELHMLKLRLLEEAQARSFEQ